MTRWLPRRYSAWTLLGIALVVLVGLLVLSALSATSVSATTKPSRPSAPRHVDATGVANGATVRFLVPVSSGTTRVSHYEVVARPGHLTFRCPTTTCVISHLTNGVTYSFTVAAVNQAGRGPSSPPSNRVVPDFAITYNANGGTGSMAKEVEASKGLTTLVPSDFSLAGSGFAGWNTVANGSGSSFDNDGAYDFTSSVTLYAQWMVGAYSVTFNANGASGTMVAQSASFNTIANLDTNAFTYQGYAFNGWNTLLNGAGTSYNNGAPFTFSQSLTLYAQWTLTDRPFVGSTSSNWAGYILQGSPGGYQAVSGQWVVPTLNCTAQPDGVVSIWVGVNGTAATGPELFQTGISVLCQSGQEFASAWWTDGDEGLTAQTLFVVNEGDTIFAEVVQGANGTWSYSVTDLTTNENSSESEAFNGQGTSAEWIVEDPTNVSSQNLFTFANFAPITITNLGLTVPGATWNLPDGNDAVEMIDNNNAVMAVPGPVLGTGTSASFNVVYETST